MKRAIAAWSALLLTALLTSGPALPAISETAEAAATKPGRAAHEVCYCGHGGEDAVAAGSDQAAGRG